jgi:hypothetical protein
MTQALRLQLVLHVTIPALIAQVLPITLAQLVSPQGRSPLVSASAILAFMTQALRRPPALFVTTLV